MYYSFKEPFLSNFNIHIFPCIAGFHYCTIKAIKPAEVQFHVIIFITLVVLILRTTQKAYERFQCQFFFCIIYAKKRFPLFPLFFRPRKSVLKLLFSLLLA